MNHDRTTEFFSSSPLRRGLKRGKKKIVDVNEKRKEERKERENQRMRKVVERGPKKKRGIVTGERERERGRG